MVQGLGCYSACAVCFAAIHGMLADSIRSPRLLIRADVSAPGESIQQGPSPWKTSG